MTSVAIVLSEAGYHWEEAAAAYKEWDAAGWKVVLYTPTGGVPTADPTSVGYMPVPLRSVGSGETVVGLPVHHRRRTKGGLQRRAQGDQDLAGRSLSP